MQGKEVFLKEDIVWAFDTFLGQLKSSEAIYPQTIRVVEHLEKQIVEIVPTHEVGSNWHTGTPTKEDWYFVMWKDTDDNWTRFSALLWNNGNKTWYDDVTPETNWGDEYHAEVIAWMPIPPFKEGEK